MFLTLAFENFFCISYRGCAAVSVFCILILPAEQAMIPMMEHFLWTRANYSAANHVPYGWAGTGYREIGSGLGVLGWIFYSALLIVVATPAVLPLVTWPPGRSMLQCGGSERGKGMGFLILCSIALLFIHIPAVGYRTSALHRADFLCPGRRSSPSGSSREGEADSICARRFPCASSPGLRFWLEIIGVRKLRPVPFESIRKTESFLAWS